MIRDKYIALTLFQCWCMKKGQEAGESTLFWSHIKSFGAKINSTSKGTRLVGYAYYAVICFWFTHEFINSLNATSPTDSTLNNM